MSCMESSASRSRSRPCASREFGSLVSRLGGLDPSRERGPLYDSAVLGVLHRLLKEAVGLGDRAVAEAVLEERRLHLQHRVPRDLVYPREAEVPGYLLRAVPVVRGGGLRYAGPGLEGADVALEERRHEHVVVGDAERELLTERLVVELPSDFLRRPSDGTLALGLKAPRDLLPPPVLGSGEAALPAAAPEVYE